MVSRSAAANLRGGSSRICENSPLFADSEFIASNRHELIRTVKRMVASLFPGCTQNKMLCYAFLRLRNPMAPPAIARTTRNITGFGMLCLAVLGAGADRLANSIGILSCDTATVLG